MTLLHSELVQIATLATDDDCPEMIIELFECGSLFEARERLSQVRAKAEAAKAAEAEWQRIFDDRGDEWARETEEIRAELRQGQRPKPVPGPHLIEDRGNTHAH